MKRTVLVAATLSVEIAMCAPGAKAQSTFPSHPVTIVISYAAGGPSDVIARILAQYMSASLGQPFMIENVAGAGGTAGAARAAKAQPDGHTLLIHHVALAVGAGLYPKLAYDTLTAFEPIGLINSNPFVFTGKKTLPVNSAKEAIEYIRGQGGKVSIGHAGVGSGAHLCNLLLQSALGLKVSEVAYRGTGPAMTDVVAGQIDFLFDQTIGAVPQIKAGTIKAFAVTSSKRLGQLSDLPTMQEAGLSAFEVTQWHALYAPAGTPKPVLTKIGDALEAALKQPDIAKRFQDLGSALFPVGARGPAETRAMLASEVSKWAGVIKASGVKPTD